MGNGVGRRLGGLGEVWSFGGNLRIDMQPGAVLFLPMLSVFVIPVSFTTVIIYSGQNVVLSSAHILFLLIYSSQSGHIAP